MVEEVETKKSMNFDLFTKRMSQYILILSGVALVLCIIYYRSWDFLPFLWGLVLGSLVSVIRVLLMKRTVNKATSLAEDYSSSKLRGQITLQQLFRFLLVAAVLILASKVEQISFWGAVVGVLVYQPALYLASAKSPKEARKIQVEILEPEEKEEEQVENQE